MAERLERMIPRPVVRFMLSDSRWTAFGQRPCASAGDNDERRMGAARPAEPLASQSSAGLTTTKARMVGPLGKTGDQRVSLTSLMIASILRKCSSQLQVSASDRALMPIVESLAGSRQ